MTQCHTSAGQVLPVARLPPHENEIVPVIMTYVPILTNFGTMLNHIAMPCHLLWRVLGLLY